MGIQRVLGRYFRDSQQSELQGEIDVSHVPIEVL